MQMTTEQVLEAAAIAFGFQVKGFVNDKLVYFDPIREYAGYGDWNPLKNPGDALELATRLGMNITNGKNYVEVEMPRRRTGLATTRSIGWSDEYDRLEATMKAITLLAAGCPGSL